jgi:hypothetical protein
MVNSGHQPGEYGPEDGGPTALIGLDVTGEHALGDLVPPVVDQFKEERRRIGIRCSSVDGGEFEAGFGQDEIMGGSQQG